MSNAGDHEPPDDPRLRRPAPAPSWQERVEQLADATGTTPARILVGGAAAVVAVVVGVWLTRSPAAPPEAALPFASTTVSLATPSTVAASASTLVVHVAGAVVDPGVHELSPGARVVDAIKAAGGLTPDADQARINLAAPVTDGERVYVPKVGEDEPPIAVGSSGGAGASGASASAPVNLNRADAAALDALPGVGPSTAMAIIEHRSKIGRFTSVDQLLDVRGIGEAKLEQLRPLVTV